MNSKVNAPNESITSGIDDTSWAWVLFRLLLLKLVEMLVLEDWGFEQSLLSLLRVEAFLIPFVERNPSDVDQHCFNVMKAFHVRGLRPSGAKRDCTVIDEIQRSPLSQ